MKSLLNTLYTLGYDRPFFTLTTKRNLWIAISIMITKNMMIMKIMVITEIMMITKNNNDYGNYDDYANYDEDPHLVVYRHCIEG